MADYTTSTDVKAQIVEGFGSTDTSYDTLIGVLITAASRAIDRELGKWPNYFYPSSDATTRYYDGSGRGEIWIDDAVSVSSVSVSETGGVESTDYTLWGSTDYITWPYNYGPITKIILDEYNGSQSLFWAYPKSVKVSAVFGFSASPPEDVKQACEIQTIRWFMRAKQAYADNGAGGEFGQVTINMSGAGKPLNRLDPDVVALLYHYKIASGV